MSSEAVTTLFTSNCRKKYLESSEAASRVTEDMTFSRLGSLSDSLPGSPRRLTTPKPSHPGTVATDVNSTSTNGNDAIGPHNLQKSASFR